MHSTSISSCHLNNSCRSISIIDPVNYYQNIGMLISPLIGCISQNTQKYFMLYAINQRLKRHLAKLEFSIERTHWACDFWQQLADSWQFEVALCALHLIYFHFLIHNNKDFCFIYSIETFELLCFDSFIFFLSLASLQLKNSGKFRFAFEVRSDYLSSVGEHHQRIRAPSFFL